MTRDELIERVVSAYRERRGDGAIAEAPAWHDLDEAGREEAARRASALRAVEAACDAEGLSTTARAVLRMIRG